MRIEKYVVITPLAIAKWIGKVVSGIYGVRMASVPAEKKVVALGDRKCAYYKGVFVRIERNVPQVEIYVKLDPKMPVGEIVRNIRSAAIFTLENRMHISKYQLDVKYQP